MEYTTDYIMVEGDRNTFEKEMSRLANQGYIWCCNTNMIQTEKGVLYSQLVQKTTPIGK